MSRVEAQLPDVQCAPLMGEPTLCANSSAGGSSDDSERVQHVDWTEIEFVRVWELVNTNIRVGWLRMWYGGGDGAGWPRNGR